MQAEREDWLDIFSRDEANLVSCVQAGVREEEVSSVKIVWMKEGVLEQSMRRC